MQLRAPPSRSPSHRPAASSGQFSPVHAPGPTYSSIVKETPEIIPSALLSATPKWKGSPLMPLATMSTPTKLVIGPHPRISNLFQLSHELCTFLNFFSGFKLRPAAGRCWAGLSG